ncbi:hypothetical protein FB451DRAFT_1171496 [Mycena latifolia]|nr:hypothetical protein FB451DRAFT_1171496 [Mycena latifolia]
MVVTHFLRWAQRQGTLALRFFVAAGAGPGKAEGSIANKDKSSPNWEACTDQQSGRRARALLIDARHGLMDARRKKKGRYYIMQGESTGSPEALESVIEFTHLLIVDLTGEEECPR